MHSSDSVRGNFVCLRIKNFFVILNEAPVLSNGIHQFFRIYHHVTLPLTLLGYHHLYIFEYHLSDKTVRQSTKGSWNKSPQTITEIPAKVFLIHPKSRINLSLNSINNFLDILDILPGNITISSNLFRRENFCGPFSEKKNVPCNWYQVQNVLF